MIKFEWHGRLYGEKDIIIWILLAVCLFTISYTNNLENVIENLDYDLQKCEITTQQQPLIFPRVVTPLIKINISEINNDI